MVEIINAEQADKIETIRDLFREYEEFLNVDLCFQDFENELKTLPGKYALPKGALLLALADEKAVGCVALREIEEGVCEMKRLFVRERHRNSQLGLTLAKRIIDEARDIGYSKMRLDSLRHLDAALSLYKSLGFKEIASYCHNPFQNVVYMELEL